MDSGRFLGMQSHQPTLAAVTTYSVRVDRAVTTVRLFHLHAGILVRYYTILLLQEGGSLP